MQRVFNVEIWEFAGVTIFCLAVISWELCSPTYRIYSFMFAFAYLYVNGKIEILRTHISNITFMITFCCI